jgi:hypothetical protein
LLISGAMGVSRSGTTHEGAPNYQLVPWPDKDVVLAALTRTVFTSSDDSDIATYTHRVVGEYLAARYIATRIPAGLPLSRAQALLGVDGYPVPSLRGLFGWLTTTLPLEARAFISKDPVAALTYGDAASWTPSVICLLITALRPVLAENPWITNQEIPDYALKGLSRTETAGELASIIMSGSEPLALKWLLLRAVLVGDPLPRYRVPLESILADASLPDTFRELAFEALTRYGPDATAACARTYLTQISNEPASFSLKVEIVATLYSNPFGPEEVLNIFKLAETRDDADVVIGQLWPLAMRPTTAQLFEILERYETHAAQVSDANQRRATSDVQMCVDRMIGRICELVDESDTTDIHRLLSILRRRYEGGTESTRTIRFSEILSKKPGLASALVDSVVRNLHEFKYPALLALTLNRALEVPSLQKPWQNAFTPT